MPNTTIFICLEENKRIVTNELSGLYHDSVSTLRKDASLEKMKVFLEHWKCSGEVITYTETARENMPMESIKWEDVCCDCLVVLNGTNQNIQIISDNPFIDKEIVPSKSLFCN